MEGKSPPLSHLSLVIGMLMPMRLLLITLFITITSCSTAKGPDVVVLTSQSYALAFDAAIQSAKEEGFQPVFLDRRSGTISTKPLIGGSILEPWKPKGSNPRQSLENTLALQRRTAKFEFVPVTAPTGDNYVSTQLSGPDLLAPSTMDLTTYDGSVELRVWVFVDRHYTQGKQVSTSSFRGANVSKTLSANDNWEQIPESFWTPIARDVSKERTLLKHVEQSLKH